MATKKIAIKKRKQTIIELPEPEPSSERIQDLPKTGTGLDLFNELDSKDKAIVNNILQHPAINNQQLGKLLKVSARTIYERLQRPEVKQCLERLQVTDLELFIACRRQAILVLQDAMMNGTENSRVQAAKEFVKGIVPTRLQIEPPMTYNLTEEEEIEVEKQLGIEIRKSSS